MDTHDPESAPKRKVLRLPSLGVLLVVMLFVICGGILVSCRMARTGIRRVEALGGYAEWDSNFLSDRVQGFLEIDEDALATDRNVYVVGLSGPRATDEALKVLHSFGSIECLTIEDSAMTDNGTEHIAAASSLTELWLTDCPNITDAGIRRLAGLPRLRFLVLSGLLVSGAGIAQATQVEDLHLDNCPMVDDAMLEEFNALHSLTSLSLYDSPRITDAGLGTLSRLPRLEYLGLNGLQVTGRGIAPLVQIRTLQVGSCPNVDDSMLEAIQDLDDLYDLSVTNSAVTDAGIRHLAGLPKLRRLNLSGSEITDEGLATLVVACSDLTDLSLERVPGITDEGVLGLAVLKSLTTLSIYNSRISTNAAVLLSKKLPKCEVRHE